MRYENHLSTKQIKQWLRYYSSKPNSILERLTNYDGYYLNTHTPRHKLFVHDIIPKVKREYTKIEDFSDRNQAIIKLYKKGLTLQEVGDEFNITRERVRQILRPAFEIGIVEKNKRHISERALQSMKDRGVRKGMKQKHPERNAKIARLAVEGFSYTEIATKIGVSRSTVCSAMYRYKKRNSK